jgi:hypothetical protein
MAKGKYQELFDLGEDAILALERGVRAGQPKMHIAKQLHNAGQLKTITQRKLARLIAAYEKDVMDRALMKRIDGTGILAAARTAANLNLNEEMMTAVALQRERVERSIEIASKTPGLLVEQHGKEIERYHKLVEGTARVQMDLGIIQKAPRRVTGQLMRDANNPNRVMFEMTEETLSAAAEVEQILSGDFVGLALPAPDKKSANA